MQLQKAFDSDSQYITYGFDTSCNYIPYCIESDCNRTAWGYCLRLWAIISYTTYDADFDNHTT